MFTDEGKVCVSPCTDGGECITLEWTPVGDKFQLNNRTGICGVTKEQSYWDGVLHGASGVFFVGVVSALVYWLVHCGGYTKIVHCGTYTKIKILTLRGGKDDDVEKSVPDKPGIFGIRNMVIIVVIVAVAVALWKFR